MEELYRHSFWPLFYIQNNNPYGRVGVRGQTFKPSPKAAQHKRSRAKAARRNTQHMRRMAKH